MNVAMFICYVGLLSALSQTVLLSTLIKYIGPKKTILIGLIAQLVELIWYGLGTQIWGVWAAGLFVSISSITYAAISAYLSLDTDKDKQVIFFCSSERFVITGYLGSCARNFDGSQRSLQWPWTCSFWADVSPFWDQYCGSSGHNPDAREYCFNQQYMGGRIFLFDNDHNSCQDF